MTGLSPLEQFSLQQSIDTKDPHKRTAVVKRKRGGSPISKTPVTPKKLKTESGPLSGSQSPWLGKGPVDTQSYATSRRSQTIKQEYGSATSPYATSRKAGSAVKREYDPSNALHSHSYQPSANIKVEYDQDNQEPSIILLSGNYLVTCPTATEALSDFEIDDLHLTVCKDNRNNKWWARFDWFHWQCIMQMNPGPSYETLNAPCPLTWRFRDRTTGRSHFQRGNAGEATFSEDHRVDVCLFNVPEIGHLEFWGHWVEALSNGECGEDFYQQWTDIPRQAYSRS